MPKHRTGRRTGLVATVVVVVIAAMLGVAATLFLRGRDASRTAGPTGACPRSIKVITASSFLPVLTELAPQLASAKDCLRVEAEAVDGRAAVTRVGTIDADLWIPDDAAWATTLPAGRLAANGAFGSGTVIATSPVFMVSDRPTITKVEKAGGSWLTLANLLESGSGVRLAVADPGRTGDGLIAAGSVAEAVWIDKGMDASALALADFLKVTRTISDSEPALPNRPGEIGLVPEYALLPALASLPSSTAYLAGTDHTALMRYTWLPTRAAVDNPDRAAAIIDLRAAMDSAESAKAINAAGLRAPDGAPPTAAAGRLPATTAKPFDVFDAHKVEHVFASWYPADRRTDLTLVVDVSGSMADPAPGSQTPLIELVRAGCLTVSSVLPDDARLGLWEFGSLLSPPRDYLIDLPTAPLTAEHRKSFAEATSRLAPRRTGTGLYDTILAAYQNARDNFQPDMPNHVLVFTDGRNEDDPGAISAEQLTAQLTALHDPKREVQVSVVAFGDRPDVKALTEVLKPINGYVQGVTAAEQVAPIFMHQAAGGLHG